jgi:uncharacterized protein (DUF2147 family)
MHLLVSLASLFALAAASTATPQAAQGAFGTWTNPTGTVAVRTSGCGGGLCGAIVWARPKALEDARQAGVAHLIGTELLQNYRQTGRGVWSGRVDVPDMARSFPCYIVQTGANQLTISGCLVGRLLCRSQIWRRVG